MLAEQRRHSGMQELFTKFGTEPFRNFHFGSESGKAEARTFPMKTVVQTIKSVV